MSRRTGQSRHKEKLLGQVAGLPRADYDAQSSTEDSPDILQRTLAPKIWEESRKPTAKPNSKRLKRDAFNSGSPDDLAKRSAPSLENAKPQSRQPSVEPTSKAIGLGGGAKPYLGQRKVNHSNIVSSLFAGKTTDEAMEDGQRSANSAMTPGLDWDDGRRRRGRIKQFKSRAAANALAYKEEAKNNAPTTRSKPLSNIDSVEISSSSEDERPIKKQSSPKNRTKKPQTKQTAQSKEKKPEPVLSEGSDDDIFSPIKKPITFVNPKAKYQLDDATNDLSLLLLPPPSPPLKGFKNPLRRYHVPPAKSDYQDLGVEAVIAPSAFANPFAYGLPEPVIHDKTPSDFEEFRTNAPPDHDIFDLTSSQSELKGPNSQSSTLEPRALSSNDKNTMELMNEMAALAGIDDIDAYRREIQSLGTGADKCRLCHYQLPEGYLEPWKDKASNGVIRLEMWSQICQAHTKGRLEEEWREKGYPEPNWQALASRTTKHLRALKKIITGSVDSRFRSLFAQQQKETKGRTAMLLRQERKLPFPGYYGPRGGNILLDALQDKLGKNVGKAADNDPLISRGGVSAYIQHVLVPEVAIRLIAEDMNVSESEAITILEESVDIGEKLHSTSKKKDLYRDDDDGNWIDITATQQKKRPLESPDDGWEDMDY